MITDWRQINIDFVKFLWFLFNGVCTLLVLITIVFALVDTQILKQYGEGAGTGNVIGDVFIISVCLYFVGVTAFGSVGVIKENVKVLYMYIVFLMVLTISEFVVAVYVSVQKYDLQLKASTWLRDDFFRNVTRDYKEQHEKIWDQIQITYKCCGLNGPEDYQLLMEVISVSCCAEAYSATNEYAQQQLQKACIQSTSYYPQGCKEVVLSAIAIDAQWFLAVAVTSIGFKVTGMLLAMYLAKKCKATATIYKLQVPLQI